MSHFGAELGQERDFRHATNDSFSVLGQLLVVRAFAPAMVV